MHFSTREMVRLLLVAVSAATLADASRPQERRAAAIKARDAVVEERQILTLSAGLPPDSVTKTSAPKTTESSTETTPTAQSTTTSSPPPPSSTSTSAPATTSTSSKPPAVTSSSSTATPETSTVIVTATKEDGSPTTYATQTTSTPTTSAQNNSGGGMPENTKTTVIGVVVGIGGAIVLVVLGFLAWRIWGRGRQSDESDELMSYGGAGSGVGSSGYGVEKASEAGGSSQSRTPFQSTLESYHAPTHVNPSSNF